MNAAERLWRAVAARDWPAVRAQFQPHGTVEWPVSGQRLDVGAYQLALSERVGHEPVVVGRITGDGDVFAVEARVGSERCAGFYDLHGALIDSATEYWVSEAAAPAPRQGD